MNHDREAVTAPGYRSFAVARPAPVSRRRWLLVGAVALFVVALAAVAALVAAGWAAGEVLRAAPEAVGEGAAAVAPPAPDDTVRERGRLERAIARQRPRGLYVVVDIHRNQLRLMRDDEVLREAVVSTGSGAVLRDPRDGREWVFDTPLGERIVQKKVRNPIWYKPDWAFVEEGRVPPKDLAERTDDVSLGDYALYLGDGYLIHGTLFQSLLGTSVTHGCVRVGDADLEYLYRHVPVGTKVFLY
jgi:L,D-transpeptidase YbiS